MQEALLLKPLIAVLILPIIQRAAFCIGRTMKDGKLKRALLMRVPFY